LEHCSECNQEVVEVVLGRRASVADLALLVQSQQVVVVEVELAGLELHAEQREHLENQELQHTERAQVADRACDALQQDTQILVGLCQLEHTHQAQCTQGSQLAVVAVGTQRLDEQFHDRIQHDH